MTRSRHQDSAPCDGIAVVPILERVRGCKEAVAEHQDIKIVSIQNEIGRASCRERV